MQLFKLDSGERPPIGKPFNEISAVLTKAYIFTEKFIRNKSVLDCGCGGGYGSDYFARKKAKKVIGVDLSARAIDNAKIFFKRDNLQFMEMDITHLSFRDCTFDLITSFQVIEHLKDYQKHLSEVKRVLKPGGIFITSTPNKKVTSPDREKPIFPFHFKEFCSNDLYALLGSFFKDVKVMGQKNIEKTTLRKEIEFGESWRMRVIRVISSFEIVRWMARLLPLKIKDFFTRPPTIFHKPEDFEINEKYCEDGYILIATCKKSEIKRFC